MPRVYPTPSPSSQRKNAAKKFRAQAKGISQHDADREAPIPTTSPPLQSILSPTEGLERLLADDGSGLYDNSFTNRQVALLMAYVAYPQDPVAGALDIVRSVGYECTNLHAAQSLLRNIFDRVTVENDMRRAMRLAGLGEMWWVRLIYQLAGCGSPKVAVQAAKLAAFPLGAMDDPAPSAGAKIVIEAAEELPNGGKRATRTTIEGAAEVNLAGNGSLTFPAAKPNRRRKAMNNMETM